MIHVEKNQMNRIAHLFEGIQDSMVIACLQGYNGDAYVYSWDGPRAALIVSAEYSFWGGDPESDDAKYLTEHFFEVAGTDSSTAIFSENRPGWEQTLLGCSRNSPQSIQRFGIVQKDYDFDLARLQEFASVLPEGYLLQMFDEDLYHQAMAEKWSVEFCEGFASAEDFLTRGMGVAAVKDGKLAGGISTQTVYDGGAELQLAVHPDHRQQGLASACAAAMILKCTEKNIRPHWDAANEISLKIALKMGYEYKGKYTAVLLKDKETNL